MQFVVTSLSCACAFYVVSRFLFHVLYAIVFVRTSIIYSSPLRNGNLRLWDTFLFCINELICIIAIFFEHKIRTILFSKKLYCNPSLESC